MPTGGNLLREPVFRIGRQFLACRSVLAKFSCFKSFEKRPWHLLNPKSRYRYVKEANRHSVGLSCSYDANGKKVSKRNKSPDSQNDFDYCGDADAELSDDEHHEEEEEQNAADEYGVLFEPNVNYDETNWPVPKHVDEPEMEADTVPSGGENIDVPDDVVINPSAEESDDVNWVEVDVERAQEFNVNEPALFLDDEIEVELMPTEDIEFALILRNCAIERHLSGETVDYIMNALKRNNSHPMFQSLPKSHKTLYTRYRQNPIVINYHIQEWNDIANAKFCYVGVENRLEQYFLRIVKRPVNTDRMDVGKPHFKILVNVDGLELSDKGVMKSIWPIAIRVHSVAVDGFGTEEEFIQGYNPPLFVALYHGSKKPQCFCRLLDQFVEEMIKLHPGTDEDEFRKFTCEIFAFICDSPARADCKDVNGLQSKYPCEKCRLRGYKLSTNFMSIWNLDNLEQFLRTDYDFATDANHVRDVDNLSPLTKIPGFGMVTQFPFDTMHSVYHGGVKAFFNQIFNGTLRYDNALPFQIRTEMRKESEIFMNLSPCEFKSSRLSSLSHMADYKAAVMRHFVNYISIPLFYNNAPKETFELLTSLVIALYLLGGASPTPVPDIDLNLGRQLLDYFVKTALFRHFSRVATPGMHMLLHIADDCKNLQCHLDYLGAWPFENGMKILLNSRRSNHRAIQQILRREMENLNCRLPTDNSGRILSRTPLAQYIGNEYHRILYPPSPTLTTNKRNKTTVTLPLSMGGFKLKANVRDAFCVVSTGSRRKDFVIVQCTDFCLDKSAKDGGIVAIGHPYKIWSDVFSKPKPSHRYHVYRFREKMEQVMKFRVEKIITKLYAIPDLKIFKKNAALDREYKYSSTPYPKSDTWAAGKLKDFPAWFGTGLRHVDHGGASLY